MFKILDEKRYENRKRNYYLVETRLGKIVYYTMDANEHETVSYKNISERDIFWRTKNKEGFISSLNVEPIEIFSSKRLKGFSKDKIVVGGDKTKYHLMTKKEYDGYLYEVSATDLRAFPSTKYPDVKFIYTKYHVDSIKMMNGMQLERMATEKVIEFNGHNSYDMVSVSNVVDAVYDYVNKL